MRISDWSSDVCSSDLPQLIDKTVAFIHFHRSRIEIKVQLKLFNGFQRTALIQGIDWRILVVTDGHHIITVFSMFAILECFGKADRNSVVEGKGVSVRVVIGGRVIIKKKTQL